MNYTRISGFIVLFIYISAINAQAVGSYDLNGNGIVDIGDIRLIGEHFNEFTNALYDVTCDGVVDILDVTVVGQHLGEKVVDNITVYCIGNCSNPKNVLMEDGNYTRIYGDGNGENAVVVDLGKEVTIAGIEVKFFNNYSSEEYYEQGLGYFEDFDSQFNNINIWNSSSLPIRGTDYDIENNGEEEVMWIRANDNGSKEMVVTKYNFESLIDMSFNPFLSYKLKVSDENINTGIQYIEVSNGSGSIKIWVPDSYYSSTFWVNRTLNIYKLASSYGDYRYLKSIGLMINENSNEIQDNIKHYAYWDFLVIHNKNYRLYISNDKNNWELVNNESILIEPKRSEIIVSNNIWESSNFSTAKYIKIDGFKGNLWLDKVAINEGPVTLMSSTAEIIRISADNDSFMLVTPDSGNSTFIFQSPIFNKLEITDNTKMKIYYENLTVIEEPGWNINHNNGILTLQGNLSDGHNYLMLDFNPAEKIVKTGYVGYLRNENDTNYFINSNFDWFWYHSQSGTTKTYAKDLTLNGKKVILRAWWWSNPLLKDKTWDDLYNNVSLINITINDIVSQIEASNEESIYAISLGEEEPLSGYKYNGKSINQTNYILSSNKIYNFLKSRYPTIKIFTGTHVMQISENNLTMLNRDGIVDNWFSPLNEMNLVCDKLVKEQKNREVYFFIWSSINNIDMPPRYTQEAFDLCKKKGLNNLGFFAATFNSTKDFILFNDYFNNELQLYQRPEIYKEIMIKIVNKN